VTRQVTSATRLIALLGDPVAHSLSPVFQNAALAAAGLDAVYLALRARHSEVPGLLRGIARAGGAGNVTLPHKELAAATIEVGTSAVERTGACNTFWLEGERVHGDNTDVVGVAEAARSLLGGPPAGARVLLLGAGGSARAAVAAMLDRGADEIVIANRTAEKAESLARRFQGGPRLPRALPLEALGDERFDLVINATSLGLRPKQPLPLSPEHGPSIGAALDLVYSRSGTPWVRALQARGIPAADGREMLIFQGAASFERWWGMPAPVEQMRSALAEASAAAP
jgi:shikimate dehydrogenase